MSLINKIKNLFNHDFNSWNVNKDIIKEIPEWSYFIEYAGISYKSCRQTRGLFAEFFFQSCSALCYLKDDKETREYIKGQANKMKELLSAYKTQEYNACFNKMEELNMETRRQLIRWADM